MLSSEGAVSARRTGNQVHKEQRTDLVPTVEQALGRCAGGRDCCWHACRAAARIAVRCRYANVPGLSGVGRAVAGRGRHPAVYAGKLGRAMGVLLMDGRTAGLRRLSFRPEIVPSEACVWCVVPAGKDARRRRMRDVSHHAHLANPASAHPIQARLRNTRPAISIQVRLTDLLASSRLAPARCRSLSSRSRVWAGLH